MIVYVGDWIKVMGAWRQVCDVNPFEKTFVTVSKVDGDWMIWGTENPEFFEGHMSDIEFQEKLKEAGL